MLFPHAFMAAPMDKKIIAFVNIYLPAVLICGI